MQFSKFVAIAPSVRNAVDVFADRWSTPIEADDPAAEMRARADGDQRPIQAIRAFGTDGRLNGMKVLELGPLEAAHTYSLEKAGASVRSVEGNAEAFMKCLVVKEVLQLTAKFELGNFLPLLEESEERYDMIFASGVLYHMPDPLRLLKAVAARTDQAFFWTHYYEPADPHPVVAENVERDGLSVTYHRIDNGNSEENGRWWGGLYDSTCWVGQEDILKACRFYGFTDVEVVGDVPYGATSAHMSFICKR